MTPRDRQIELFLARAGWSDAARARLAGDASNRKYDRLVADDGNRAVLMDADPAKGEDVGPFLHIDAALRSAGLSAPAILAEDREHGLLLLEDLGDDLFARVLADEPALEPTLYAAATDVLTHLHRAPPPAGVRPYDGPLMGRMARLSVDWYARGATGIDPPDAEGAAFADRVTGLAARLAPEAPVLVLRDYHAENLIWLPDRTGPARVGLLDFQDAMTGPRAYDLVSMLQDARRDVSPAVEAAMIARYVTQNGLDQSLFSAEYAFCGAQRNLRILGVFARLSMHFGKAWYVDLIPRVWALLQRDLAHPALSELADAAGRLLPAPTPAALQRIKDECGRHPMR